MFFILQTHPEYIAKLTRLVSQKEIDGLLQTVMFSLYGNQYENREEHLLLSMFEVRGERVWERRYVWREVWINWMESEE